MSVTRLAYRIILIIPAIILTSAVLLSLVGYGAASAIESTFGISRELTYESPLDLLHLSSLSIIGGIDQFSNFLKHNFLTLALAAVIVGLAASLLCLTLKYIHTLLVKFNRSRKIIEIKANLKKARIYSAAKWAHKNGKLFIPLLVVAVGPWAIISILSITITTLTIAPLFGFNTAEKHLKKWTIDADYCVPLLNREARTSATSNPETKSQPKKLVTPCLSIWKNGSMLAEGRHITSTSRHIILFEPLSGNVILEPINGVSLRSSTFDASKGTSN